MGASASRHSEFGPFALLNIQLSFKWNRKPKTCSENCGIECSELKMTNTDTGFDSKLPVFKKYPSVSVLFGCFTFSRVEGVGSRGRTSSVSASDILVETSCRGRPRRAAVHAARAVRGTDVRGTIGILEQIWKQIGRYRNPNFAEPSMQRFRLNGLVPCDIVCTITTFMLFKNIVNVSAFLQQRQ